MTKKDRTAREVVARWLHSMDTDTKWRDENVPDKAIYLDMADKYLAEPVNVAVRTEAWDEGYSRGNLDGYFGTRNETNPYRESVR